MRAYRRRPWAGTRCAARCSAGYPAQQPPATSFHWPLTISHQQESSAAKLLSLARISPPASNRGTWVGGRGTRQNARAGEKGKSVLEGCGCRLRAPSTHSLCRALFASDHFPEAPHRIIHSQLLFPLAKDWRDIRFTTSRWRSRHNLVAARLGLADAKHLPVCAAP